MANTTLKMTMSNCEKSWSGTTRTINFGPHICDLCLWIDALLHSLWETKIFRKSQIEALWWSLWRHCNDVWAIIVIPGLFIFSDTPWWIMYELHKAEYCSGELASVRRTNLSSISNDTFLSTWICKWYKHIATVDRHQTDTMIARCVASILITHRSDIYTLGPR